MTSKDAREIMIINASASNIRKHIKDIVNGI